MPQPANFQNHTANLGRSQRSRWRGVALHQLRGAVALLALALTFAISPGAAQQWTPKQRAACEPDSMRLCNQYVPDIQNVRDCMSHYRRYLSPACRAVFQGGAKKRVRRFRR